MKILITGGAGFIGANFVHYYAGKYPEAKIAVLDKLTYAGNLANLAGLEDRHTFYKVDLADKEAVLDVFEKEGGFDTVVNFAAESHVDRSIEDPEIFIQSNVLGTHNLLEASLKFGAKRYHQVSTDEVYGDLELDSDDKFNDDSPLKPSSPYSSSKAAADLICLSYYRTFGLPVTVSRCSNNYGPYQYPEKLIPHFYMLASEGKNVPVYGDGKNVRDWIYVLDHCEGIDTVLQSGTPGKVYNMGGDAERSNLEVTQAILDYVGKGQIEFVEDRKGHDRRYAIDNSTMENEFGWKPSVDFEEGLKKTFEWYDNNKEWLNTL